MVAMPSAATTRMHWQVGGIAFEDVRKIEALLMAQGDRHTGSPYSSSRNGRKPDCYGRSEACLFGRVRKKIACHCGGMTV